MILKAVYLFLLWRKNDLKGILFKCIVFGGLAWLLVGMFTDFNTALIGGGVVAMLAAIRYGLKGHKQNRQLLKKVGGDKEKLAQLKKVTNAKGFGGALMNEMLMSELDDDDDDYEEPELTEEQKQSNIATSVQAIESMRNLIVSASVKSAAEAEETAAELIEEYEDGYSTPETNELVAAFLPESHICIDVDCFEEDEDNYEILLSEFVEATNGSWKVTDIKQTYNESDEKTTLSFKEEDKVKKWAFRSGGLSNGVVNSIMKRIEEKSSYQCKIIDNEDVVEIVCLPNAIYNELYPNAEQKAA